MIKIRPAGAELFYGSGRIYVRTDIRLSFGKFANASATSFTKRVCKLGAAFDTVLLTTGQSIQES